MSAVPEEVHNPIFHNFVQDCGGRQQAADTLECSYQLVCHILTGKRPVSKNIAEAVELASGGKYQKALLLWGGEQI